MNSIRYDNIDKIMSEYLQNTYELTASIDDRIKASKMYDDAAAHLASQNINEITRVQFKNLVHLVFGDLKEIKTRFGDKRINCYCYLKKKSSARNVC